MRFSFIVPIYNIKKSYIEKCVDSLLKQTVKDYEILLIDDGSSNGASEWCDVLEHNYNEYIRTIHKENDGVSAARNKGICEAKGEYLIFVDPDDWIEYNMCEKINMVLEKYDFDILTYFYYTEYKNKTVYERSLDDGDMRLLSYEERMELIRNLIDVDRKLEYKYFNSSIYGSVWGKCYKKTFLAENNIWFNVNLSKAEDYIFNLEAFYSSSFIVEYKALLYHYRQRATSMTHHYNKNIINIQLAFLNAMNEFINTNELDDTFREAFMHRCIRSYFCVLNLNIFNAENKNSLREKKREWLSYVEAGYLNTLSSSCLNQYSWRTKLFLRVTEMRCFTLSRFLYKIRKLSQSENEYDNFYE